MDAQELRTKDLPHTVALAIKVLQHLLRATGGGMRIPRHELMRVERHGLNVHEFHGEIVLTLISPNNTPAYPDIEDCGAPSDAAHAACAESTGNTGATGGSN